jgi:hypothetical protein
MSSNACTEEKTLDNQKKCNLIHYGSCTAYVCFAVAMTLWNRSCGNLFEFPDGSPTCLVVEKQLVAISIGVSLILIILFSFMIGISREQG